MKIAIGSDHGGFTTKEATVKHLTSKGYEVLDFGTNSLESCNYSTFALKVAEAVKDGLADKGVIICTSGEGVAIAANKVKGIRCGIAYNEEVARLIVEHNNANCVTFGAKYFTEKEIFKMLDIFLNAKFEEGRHLVRVDTISKYEEEHTK